MNVRPYSSAIRGRLKDAESKVVVTCDAVMRGAKPIQLKTQIDKTLELGDAGFVESVIVFQRLAGRGLHSSTSQLNLSAFPVIGVAQRVV